MAKFQFRLTTLKKLREAHRDEMRAKLGEAYQAERLLQQQAETIREEEAAALSMQRQTLDRRDTNVNQLLDAQRYVATLRNALSNIGTQSQMLAVEIEKRRQALIAADQQVRVLEKLRDRQLQEHQREALRAEVKVMDEVASRPKEINL